MRKAVAIAFAMLVLGVVAGAAAWIAPRARLLWTIHQLGSPAPLVASDAFAKLRDFSATDLRRERARLLPALDAFIRQSRGRRLPDPLIFLNVAEQLDAIGRDDETVLLDALRYESVAPAAYWTLARLYPARIPRERCEITLNATGVPGATVPVSPRASELDLLTGLHPRWPTVCLTFTGKHLQAESACCLDLGNIPLEEVSPACSVEKAPVIAGREMQVLALPGHTFVVQYEENKIKIAFRVTELVPGKSVHLVWRVLHAEENRRPVHVRYQPTH
jgi:hypothetical protein